MIARTRVQTFSTITPILNPSHRPFPDQHHQHQPLPDHHQLPPVRSPNNALRRVVWASGMFFLNTYIHSYLRHHSITPHSICHPEKSPSDVFRHVIWAPG